MSNIREKLDPNAGSYSVQEIAEDLEVPVEIIERMTKLGIVCPRNLEGVDLYSMKDIRFIQKYWDANKYKLIRSR